VISFRNPIQTQRHHEETIKYVQEIIDRFWEILNIMEKSEKESLML
jgi:hypothetical protein